LVTLSEKTRSALKDILPQEAGLNNPVDMIASATHETYREVCNIIEKDPGVDSILVIIVKPPVNTTPKMIISELKPLITKSQKPFFFTVMAGESEEDGREIFRESQIPVFSYPETTARALGNMVRYSRIRKSFSMPKPMAEQKSYATKLKTRQASVEEILSLLRDYKLTVCDNILAKTSEEAIEFYNNAGPVAIKIANEEIIHKSDAGMVQLNLVTENDIVNAFNDISNKAKAQLPANVTPLLLIQKMVTGGVELVLGSKRDPFFGSVIMFGIGGILIELYKDVVFRIAPLDEHTIEDMIEEIKGKKILSGFRNFAPVNKEKLIQVIKRFSMLVTDHPKIVEMDLNPIIWSEQDNDLIIVDSRCTISK
jgi:acetyltransferase